MIRVLVCGGRDYADRDTLFGTLHGIAQRHNGVRVIQGGAPGADMLAREWCRIHGHSYEHFPADWKKHDRAAGPIRNAQMLAEGRPDVVVAFPRANGEWGSGTLNMIGLAEAAGVPVERVPSPIRSEGA